MPEYLVSGFKMVKPVLIVLELRKQDWLKPGGFNLIKSLRAVAKKWGALRTHKALL
jgi:hypothetical protein